MGGAGDTENRYFKFSGLRRGVQVVKTVEKIRTNKARVQQLSVKKYNKTSFTNIWGLET